MGTREALRGGNRFFFFSHRVGGGIATFLFGFYCVFYAFFTKPNKQYKLTIAFQRARIKKAIDESMAFSVSFECDYASSS